jgi:hypothetical protein
MRGEAFQPKHERAILPALIAIALMSSNAYGQEDSCEDLGGTPPGLYVTTDEGRTFLAKEGKVLEVSPGQSAYAGENKLACITNVPAFLDWPCSTDAANSRKFATYAITDLTSQGQEGPKLAKEVVRRYFEIPEVIEPVPDWLEGEFHTKLAYADIIQFASGEYWYHPTSDEKLTDERRPKVLQISLFVGINAVVVDSYMIELLKNHYGNEHIPVVFVFNDSNTVPISFFGPNVSLEEIYKSFNERGIKIADAPMWPLGDYTLAPTAEEFEKFFDLPALEDIDPVRREALTAQLETFGFSKKPAFVTMMSGGGKIYVDDPALIRIALSMGMERIPTALTFVEPDAHLTRCGPGTPVGSSGGAISGESTPPGGAVVPPGGGGGGPVLVPGETIIPTPETPVSPAGGDSG